MNALKEHFLKLVITALFGAVLYVGQSYVKTSQAETMVKVNENSLNIKFIHQDIREIKEMVKELVARP